jgi:hypothetical protein
VQFGLVSKFWNFFLVTFSMNFGEKKSMFFARFLCMIHVGSKDIMRMSFFLSYFVNSQIGLNRLVDDICVQC